MAIFAGPDGFLVAIYYHIATGRIREVRTSLPDDPSRDGYVLHFDDGGLGAPAFDSGEWRWVLVRQMHRQFDDVPEDQWPAFVRPLFDTHPTLAATQ